MKLPLDFRLPLPNPSTQTLTQRLYSIFREISNKVNESGMWSSSSSAIPSDGTWAEGDTVKNSSPEELGSAGSKYVLVGWICSESGTPGTWHEMRVLTGG